MKALGMVETRGMVPAVEAVDTMMKSANVEVLSVKEIGGGLVSVYVQGDVGAVKQAVDAAAESVKKIGELVAVHMISRPNSETLELFPEMLKSKG